MKYFSLFFITVLSLFLLSCKNPFSCCAKHSGPAVNGKINLITGDVTLNGKKAAKDDTVAYGDVIATGKNSACELLIDEKNLILVSENSRVTYKIREGDSLLEISSGGMGLLLRKKILFKDFVVKSPTVAAAVRGTIFYVGVESPERTYACVCNGKIRFKTEGAQKEELIQASHHRANYYTREQGTIKIEKAGLKYHSDGLLDTKAASIGEKIDWTKIE